MKAEKFLEDDTYCDEAPDIVFEDEKEWYENRNDCLYLAKVVKKKVKKSLEKLNEASNDEYITVYKKIGQALYIRAMTRDDNKKSWGKLLEWEDLEGDLHTWTMPAYMTTQNGSTLLDELQENGYIIAPKNAQYIKDYISRTNSHVFARCVQKVGWHNNSYVFPTSVLKSSEDDKDEMIVLQNTSALSSNLYQEKGTFEDWQKLVSIAENNTLLVFALSVAFAGPLLEKSNLSSSGFHIFGASQTGKSTALKLAASVWGSTAHIKTWRATDNGTEAIAAMFNNNLLILDELGQVLAKICGETVYMLGNEQGKIRAKKDGTARDVQKWSVMLLSSGEITLADKLAEAGLKPKAGQAVRFVDISADAGAGKGIFEDTKGMTAKECAKLISEISKNNYGYAGKKFIQYIIDNEGIEERIKKGVKKFIENVCDADADSQVLSVAEKFGLAAVAGTIAAEAGILNFTEKTQCWAAAHKCFLKWLENRGGSGSGEDQAILNELYGFIEKHGQSRFQTLSPRTDIDGNIIEQTVINRVGFRDTEGKTEDVYYVLPESWGSEIMKGFNPRYAAKIAAEAGILKKSEGDRMTTKITLTGMGRTACYKLAFSKEEN